MGKYKNEERNGLWKEYNLLGKLIFEGEYKNGKRLKGKAQEYSPNGKLICNVGYLIWEINGKV